MDIVEFLAARLDEDQRIAQAAYGELESARSQYSPDEWEALDSPDLDVPNDDRPGIYHHGLDAWWTFAGQHQRPSRALADVAAKRAILELHEPTGSDLFDDGIRWCRSCPSGDGWPCLTVRALTQSYADHPDYDPAWTNTPT